MLASVLSVVVASVVSAGRCSAAAMAFQVPTSIVAAETPTPRRAKRKRTPGVCFVISLRHLGSSVVVVAVVVVLRAGIARCGPAAIVGGEGGCGGRGWGGSGWCGRRGWGLGGGWSGRWGWFWAGAGGGCGCRPGRVGGGRGGCSVAARVGGLQLLVDVDGLLVLVDDEGGRASGGGSWGHCLGSELEGGRGLLGGGGVTGAAE